MTQQQRHLSESFEPQVLSLMSSLVPLLHIHFSKDATMAADNASPQGSIDTGATSPQDDNYPALPSRLPVRLRPELVMQPDALTLYLGFFGTRNWRDLLAEGIVSRVGGIWVAGGRSPTQDELDSITTSASRAVYTKRLSFPIFYTAGASWLYYQARQSHLFPKNPTPANLLSTLHNFRMADRAAFRSLLFRSSFQMLFLFSATHIVTSFAATWNETSFTLKDPRMKTFVEDLRNLNQEDARRRKLAITNDLHRRSKDGSKPISDQIREELGIDSNHDQGDQGHYAYDSVSPSAVSTESDMTYSTGQSNDQDVSAPGSSSLPSSREQQMYGQYGSAGRAASQSSGGDLTSDFFGSNDNDDASPTAPEYRNTNINDMPSGSAWDRIRQQNSAQSSRPAAPRQVPMQWGQAQAQNRSAPENSSFSSEQSRYDYDRRREKEQAQANFDKMMEAERNAAGDGPSRGGTW